MKPNIGNSILASSSPAILTPIETPVGVVQVRKMREQDTHGLFLVENDALLAAHPNGFSCHVLAVRLQNNGNFMDQADYIVACGGTITEEGKDILLKAQTFFSNPQNK